MIWKKEIDPFSKNEELIYEVHIDECQLQGKGMMGSATCESGVDFPIGLNNKSFLFF